jgi:hypothetical protein
MTIQNAPARPMFAIIAVPVLQIAHVDAPQKQKLSPNNSKQKNNPDMLGIIFLYFIYFHYEIFYEYPLSVGWLHGYKFEW